MTDYKLLYEIKCKELKECEEAAEGWYKVSQGYLKDLKELKEKMAELKKAVDDFCKLFENKG